MTKKYEESYFRQGNLTNIYLYEIYYHMMYQKYLATVYYMEDK